MAAAVAAGLVEEVWPEYVLDLNLHWESCAFRITPDDERRPITNASVNQGLMWDVSSLPAGNYKVQGYTWDPPYNRWVMRPGVIKVVDDPDPAASGPAVAIVSTEQIVTFGGAAFIDGCLDAMPGTTLSLQWGGTIEFDEWLEHSKHIVPSGPFRLEFRPPEQVTGNAAMLRVVATDPMGRESIGYMEQFVVALGDPGSDDGCGFIGCPPGTDPDPDPATSTGCDTDCDGGEAPAATGDAESCACDLDLRGGAGGLGVLLLLGLRHARRRA